MRCIKIGLGGLCGMGVGLALSEKSIVGVITLLCLSLITIGIFQVIEGLSNEV
jgi:hypothetical protein